MSPLFQPQQLERDYAFVQHCPEHLLPLVLTLPLGSLQERVAGIVTWRDALLAGKLPPVETWPGPAVSLPARKALVQLRVVPLCRGQQEIVDELLTDLIKAWGQQTDDLESEALKRLLELVEAERRRRAAAPQRSEDVQLPADLLQQLRLQANGEVGSRPRHPSDFLLERWGERCRAWHEIGEVFGDLGHMLNTGFDLAAGVLRHAGWQKVKELHQLVRRLPQLRKVIRTLGRLRDDASRESVSETVLVPLRRIELERHEIPTPEVPGEVRGIDRSGEISRMLPCESLMLGHPRLRLLWHARRAERALLTYRVEGVMTETTLVETETQVEEVRKKPRPERGPIVAVIDTSGSMAGQPELIAKALVLEAACTANAEKRKCLLFLYGSTGEVLEQELSLDADGIPRLLTFLGQSFGGGTDIGAMRRVLERLEEAKWRKADVLLASDGDWAAPPELIAATQKAKKTGTRFHGILIGTMGSAMEQLCSPVHRFADWQAMLPGRV